MKRKILLIALSFALFGATVKAQEIKNVSLVRLIANPQQFNGASVRVIGFVRIKFEGNAIYLHQDDEKYSITKNGLWLSIPDEIRKNPQKFDDKYVLVEGIFNAAKLGHMRLFSGSIENIKRFQVWAEVNEHR